MDKQEYITEVVIVHLREHPDWKKYYDFRTELYSRDSLNRLKSNVLKSMDVAFVICNYSILDCGAGHFQAVLCEILPTALVLNLPIWPFLRREDGSNLCICDQYLMECHHIRKLTPADLHCVNVRRIKQMLQKKNVTTTGASGPFPRHNAYIKPNKYGCEVFTVPKSLGPGFLLSMKLKLRAHYVVKTGTRLKPVYQDSTLHMRLAMRRQNYSRQEEFEYVITEDFRNTIMKVVNHRRGVQQARLFEYEGMGKAKYEWGLFPCDVVQKDAPADPSKDIKIEGKTVLKTGMCPAGLSNPKRPSAAAIKENRRKKRLEILKQLQDMICKFLKGEKLPEIESSTETTAQ